MNNSFKDDTFLARWLNNELTEEELTTFEESEDYAMYQKIIDGASTIQSQEFDERGALEQIKLKQAQAVRPIRASRKLWFYSAAASLLIAVTFLIFTITSTPETLNVVSKKGERKTHILPDGSEMILNANSSASLVLDDWELDRQIKLEGEGYFKVKAGSQFTVETSSGDVTVLGTQFVVHAVNGFFEVKCFEGRVRVKSGVEEEILKPRRAFRRINGGNAVVGTIEETSPAWIKNESSFASVPIKYVLIALENQYNITFQGKTSFDDLTFSGTFPHDDLNVALKVVLGSLQIEYIIERGGLVVLED